jgi:mono/diheme cytochrome c family protein
MTVSSISGRWTRLVLVLACAYLWGAALVAHASRVEQQSARTVWDAVYSEAQAARGKEVYRQECAPCHLDSLGGADMAPGLAGNAFLTTWNELSVGDLFERTRISMPQDNPARLTRQQYIDIVAYMLQANRFPAGANDLSHDLEGLKQIKILMKAPAH